MRLAWSSVCQAKQMVEVPRRTKDNVDGDHVDGETQH